MRLPRPRGELSAAVVAMLEHTPADRQPGPSCDATDLEDATLALWTLQELHYRGFDGVDEHWEWHPAATGLRVGLEHELEARLRKRWADAGTARLDEGQDVVEALLAVVDADDGPSLAKHLLRDGTADQALDLLRQRSVYHLKEADPTAWVVPRLEARTKAALVEIQYDEYGAGRSSRLHHALFERALSASGLESRYGAYIDEALPEVLEQNTTMTLLGLHRRLRAAALGHFTAFEATSSLPSRQLAQALRRLGLPEEVAAYYDEHVEADAVHEQLALRGICGVLVAEEPALADDVLFGAWTCLDLEARTGHAMLERWGAAA